MRWSTSRSASPTSTTRTAAMAAAVGGAAGPVAFLRVQGKRVVYCMVTSGEAGIDGIHPDECGSLREAEEIASAAERLQATAVELDGLVARFKV